MNATYRPVDKAAHREWFNAVRHRADTQIFRYP